MHKYDLTDYDCMAHNIISKIEKRFEERNMRDYIATRYYNGKYEVVLLCDLGYHKCICHFFTISLNNIQHYYNNINEVIEDCVRKVISNNQIVYRDCPVDRIGCSNSLGCMYCKYYSKHITKEDIEDNKKDNGARL